MSTSFRLGQHIIGQESRPFIIAEMSGNHNQSLERAMQIVEAAAKAGAQALKLQTYTAETMTLNLKTKDFVINDPKSLWNGRQLYDLYNQAHTPWEWQESIFKRARELGMMPFSTPFDDTSVDFLESIGAELYKIASFENTDVQLIKKVASTGKPLIISTGMASISELEDAVNTARSNGCKNLVLLKCTSTYPSTPENSNVKTIPHLRELFDCEVGLSDHTMGVGASVAAVALGATVIEKHFTLNRNDGGPDSAFSLEPQELKSLVTETERAWQSLGKVTYGCSAVEKNSLVFRRSLYITRDLKAGDVLSRENVRAVRPGYGLPTKHLDQVLGRSVKNEVKAGTALNWDLVI